MMITSDDLEYTFDGKTVLEPPDPLARIVELEAQLKDVRRYAEQMDALNERRLIEANDLRLQLAAAQRHENIHAVNVWGKIYCLFRKANAAKRDARTEIERVKECVRDYWRVDAYHIEHLLSDVLGDEANRLLGETGYEIVGSDSPF